MFIRALNIYKLINNLNTSFKDNIIDINENITSNDSLAFPFHELNSFDLNSLKPEWVVDNFSDSDGPSEEPSEVLSVSEHK